MEALDELAFARSELRPVAMAIVLRLVPELPLFPHRGVAALFFLRARSRAKRLAPVPLDALWQSSSSSWASMPPLSPNEGRCATTFGESSSFEDLLPGEDPSWYPTARDIHAASGRTTGAATAFCTREQ